MRYRESSTESSLATPSLTRIAGGIPTYLTVLRSPKKAFPPLYSQTKRAKSHPHERANSSATLFSSAVYPALPIFITQPMQRQRYTLTSNNGTTYPFLAAYSQTKEIQCLHRANPFFIFAVSKLLVSFKFAEWKEIGPTLGQLNGLFLPLL